MINLAASITYSPKELAQLQELLSGGVHDSLWMDLFIFKGGGLMDVSRDYEDGVPRQEINFMQYLLLYHRKLFLFLAVLPLQDVLKYITDENLRPFVEWRLKINR